MTTSWVCVAASCPSWKAAAQHGTVRCISVSTQLVEFLDTLLFEFSSHLPRCHQHPHPMRRATGYYRRLWVPRHPRERVGGRSRRQAGSCTRRYRGNLRFVVLGTTDSRVSDLSDFTAARRNSTRQLTHDEDNTARSEPLVANAADPPGTATLGPRSSSAQARRFFPFGRTRRFEIIPTPRPATSM